MRGSASEPDAQREWLRRVVADFALDGELVTAERLGSGHIHQTWLVVTEGAKGPRRWVQQRLNTEIFRAPDALMQNVLRVTDHLRRRLAARGVADLERRCLQVVPTRRGGPLHVDAAGGTWRCFRYIEATRSVDSVESPEQAQEAARAFGAFAALLRDLDPGTLQVTIPRFHDMTHRLEALEAAQRADVAGYSAAAAAELSGIRRCAAELEAQLPDQGVADLPVRVVHHDCKLNNLLFDASSGEALCVIDLDTVMPGTILSDFGELVRTATCSAAEDERDLERVAFDLGLFEALAGGFLAGSAGLLDAAEQRALACAGPRLALMNAVRFLTDHLGGDVYFRTHRPGQNLDRTRAQLHLAQDMLANLDAARAIVEETSP